jgi:beta-glucosidase
MNPDQPVAVRVDDLLGRMTDNEKIGQTCFVDRRYLTESVAGDPAHTESDIRAWLLGGVFSGGGSAPNPNTVQAWADMIDRFQGLALSTRLAIPLLYGSDAVHGHNNMANVTIFPHAIGLAATRDEDLLERVGRVVAGECSAAGVRWAFAPAVSVPRNEWWGRFYEGLGETPDMVSPLARAIIRGLQGTNLAAVPGILACAKHYVGDGGTTWGTGINGTIDQGDARIDEATLRALHLPPFQAVIAEGGRSVMVSLSSWQGARMHGNAYLLNQVLKQELGFKGLVVSDWNGINILAPSSYLNAITISVNAGIDMDMIPDRYVQYSQNYRSAVAAGNIDRARLDDAVRRILAVKFQLGLFERPFAERDLFAQVRSPEHLAVGREAVRKSVVVLKNDGDLLPLPKTHRRILVAGRHANDIGLQCGGWTVSWQGSPGRTTAGTTILDAIKGTVSPQTEVDYNTNGVNAAGADVAIVAIGEEPYAEFMGDTQNLRPKAVELSLVSRVRAAGVPVVVLVLSGRPLIVDPDIGNWNAVAAVWLPGTEAQGIADVLFGDFPAVGRLPHTWPRAANRIPINVGDPTYDPLFPVDYGLSFRPSLAAIPFSPPLGGRNAIVLSWPAWAAGYGVEFTTALSPAASWYKTAEPPTLVDNRWVLTITPPDSTSVFYRLAK